MILTMPRESVSHVQRTLLTATAVAESPFTLTQQVQDWGGEAWAYEFEMQVTQGRDGQRLSAFFAQLGGARNRFIWHDQAARQSDYDTFGSPEVAGGGQTGNSLDTAGWVPNVTTLRAGDLFSLGTAGETRLYQVTADVETDGSGNATVQFVPRLRTSPANEAPLEVEAPAVLLRLQGPVPANVTPADIYRFTVQAREAI
jgi:hypothetical protein